MLELRARNWEMQPRWRIMNDEITSGCDELGVLLMRHPYRSWWTGSQLTIGEARAIVPHRNATTLQVAGSIVAAVSWMIDRPDEGLCVPDHLPWEPVLKAARQYLRTFHSGPADRDSASTRRDVSAQWGDEADGVDHDDPWRFTSFVVR